MKSFLTISLGMLMLVHAASTSVIVLNYRMNRNFIIENFCENTDRPELNCNGKCHLKKQMEQEENQRSDNPIPVQETILLVLVVEELPLFRVHRPERSKNISMSPYLQRTYGSHPIGVFHPPKA